MSMITRSGLHPSRSLEEVHRTVEIPKTLGWRRLFAFAGPAYMVSVGYMDPGNWATDIAGGANFGYALLWVLLMSNLMAVLLQTLSARLGLVTGRDLAQACRDDYPPLVRYILFFLCEIAIAACDLAEVLGSAVGINLLFGIPVLWAVVITGFDVMLLLVIQRFGIRKMEAFILMLVSTIGACFIIEIFLSKPSVGGIAIGLIPRPLSGAELYVAIGILGATVMPHNLYLHSALVQSRDVHRSRDGVAQACRYNLLDSAVAMNLAFFVNAAILIVSAAAFHARGIQVDEIQQAHQLLEHVLGSGLAPVAFALALLCAGQSSTITGTLAGQITMEGFLRFKIRPWLRRLITRSIAIVPAVLVIASAGEKGVMQLLILSQVILSLQLPFAVVPLIRFTSSRQKMGPFVSKPPVKVLAWVVAALIVVLNVKLVAESIRQWAHAAGGYGWLVIGLAVPMSAGLALLLVWMTFRRERVTPPAVAVDADAVLNAARGKKTFCRIGVALEATPKDAPMLAEAIALAKAHGAELVLIHVVEGAGGHWYGPQTGDEESRSDEDYLRRMSERLARELAPHGVPKVNAILGYGDVPRQIVQITREHGIDMLVMGGHGHTGIWDWLHGQTIAGVRHKLGIPVLAVR
jgi:manganese transport protein